MMKITKVDNHNNLFCVENFYPQDLLAEFLATNHTDVVYKKEDMQYEWPRRKLMFDETSIYTQMDQYVKSQLQTIARSIDKELMACDTGFWLDEPGFSMDPHLDNDAVQVSMQIYLNANLDELGTVFYNPDNSIRYRAPYKINTGYLMINGPEQRHGMGLAVPDNSYRISSYSWLYPKV